MLVLTRKAGQSIIIRCGPHRIVVKVAAVDFEHSRVVLAIEAPRECAVDREEIALAKEGAGR